MSLPASFASAAAMDAIIAAREAERAAEVAMSTFMFSGVEQYTTEKHIALCNALTEARNRTTAAERAAASQIFGYDAEVTEPTAAANTAAANTASANTAAANTASANTAAGRALLMRSLKPNPIRRSKRLAATADKRAAAAAAQAAAEAELDRILEIEAIDKPATRSITAETRRAAKIQKATEMRARYADELNHAQKILDETVAEMDAFYVEFKKNPTEPELKNRMRHRMNLCAFFSKAQQRATVKIQEIDAYLAQP